MSGEQDRHQAIGWAQNHRVLFWERIEHLYMIARGGSMEHLRVAVPAGTAFRHAHIDLVYTTAQTRDIVAVRMMVLVYMSYRKSLC